MTRGWLGVAIQDVNEDLAESFGLDKAGGILVSDVQPDSPADKAGMKQGDVILKLEDIELKDAQDLRNRIAQTIPGTEVRLHVVRETEGD